MFKIKKLFVYLLGVLGLHSPIALAAPQVYLVKVSGMHCEGCVKVIESKIKSMPETESVSIDLKEELVTLTLKNGKTLDQKNLEAVIKKAGYKVVEIKKKS